MADEDVLNAAVGVRAVMARTYTEKQAAAMCVTARKNPGVPVTFDTEGGGKAQVVYVDLGWIVEAAS
jgi:predicted metal-binding membrane protein